MLKLKRAIVWGEMKIRSGLVVGKGSGQLIGCVHSDQFSSALDDLCNLSHTSDKKKEKPVASHIIVFMVRGLLSKVNLPFLWYSVVD